MRNFEYVNAPSTERAIELLTLEHPDRASRPKILAGGTDLLDELKEGTITPTRLVNLKANRNLRYVRFNPSEGLKIGALTTMSELSTQAEVRARYGGLVAALGMIASPQIRNVGTVGGNLCQRPRCWYYRDADLHCARKGGPICYAVGGENTYHAILGGHLCFIVHPSDLAPALIAYDAASPTPGRAAARRFHWKSFSLRPTWTFAAKIFWDRTRWWKRFRCHRRRRAASI